MRLAGISIARSVIDFEIDANDGCKQLLLIPLYLVEPTIRVNRFEGGKTSVENVLTGDYAAVRTNDKVVCSLGRVRITGRHDLIRLP